MDQRTLTVVLSDLPADTGPLRAALLAFAHEHGVSARVGPVVGAPPRDVVRSPAAGIIAVQDDVPEDA